MNFQLVIDCADPGRLVQFWAEALDYRVPEPPQGLATWRDYYLSIGTADVLFLHNVPEGKPGEPRTGIHTLMPTWGLGR